MIEGKIARVLNAREVAINKGSRDGIQKGMHFIIVDPNAENITDPDTGAALGSVDRPKARLEIVEVHAQMSVGRTVEHLAGHGTNFSSLFMFTPGRTRTLSYDDAEYPPLDEAKSVVKRGDVVREVQSSPTRGAPVQPPGGHAEESAG